MMHDDDWRNIIIKYDEKKKKMSKKKKKKEEIIKKRKKEENKNTHTFLIGNWIRIIFGIIITIYRFPYLVPGTWYRY